MISFQDRIEALLQCMETDELSIQKHIDLLKEEIYNYTLDLNFRKSKNMGEVVKNALDFVKRNYEGINTKPY